MSELKKGSRAARLGAAVSVAIFAGMAIYLVAWLASPDAAAWAAINSLGPLVLVSAFVFHSICLLLATVCWAFIMTRLGGQVPPLEHLAIYAATLAARRLPGSLWHVAGRTLLYEQRRVSKAITVLASGVEYQVVLLGGIVSLLLLWPLVGTPPWANPLLLLSGLLLGLVLLNPVVVSRLRSWFTGSEAGSVMPYLSVLLCVGLYVPIWLASGAILAMLVGAMYPVPLSHLPTVLMAWCAGGTLGMLVLLLPSGLGLNELAVSVILSTLIPGPTAVLAALAMRVITTAYDLLWSVLGLGLLRLVGARVPVRPSSVPCDRAACETAAEPAPAQVGHAERK